MPDDYHDPAGWHRHKCRQCGLIWSHEDAVAAMPKPARVAAHNCPGCRTHNEGYLYRGPSEPDRIAPQLITGELQPEATT